LKYLEWAYNSIRKNQGDHEVEVCVADDASTDGTWNWCVETEKRDPLFKWIRNMGPERQGLVILNDRLINEVATNDLCMIYHADMYLCPGALDAIEKHLKEKTIVSLTRIEPPLHPPGPEKVTRDFGIEPEEFNEEGLLNEVQELKVLHENDPGTTEGIFAPWAFWKKDFQEIGGHDELFAPQSKEDSDIFNRFHLNGVKFVQTWEGFVYHMTSRGSRFNPSSGGAPGQDSPEWLHTTTVNMKNFIRKWGHMVQHDKYLKPIIPPKYNIAIRIENSNDQLLEALEPWCDRIYVDHRFDGYVLKEQKNTRIDLIKRVHNITENDRYDYDEIVVEIDGNRFTQQDFNIIMKLPEIIQNSDGGIGEFEIGNLKLVISSLNTYEKENIICRK
jgi:glycosyltransferase involved in cell wall biosynthesis